MEHLSKNDINKSHDETELDKIVSKKIVIHLEEFFKKDKKQNTRKTN